MFKQGRQEQEKEIVYDNGEQMCCPYFKREMEKMENVKKALQEVYKSWRKYFTVRLSGSSMYLFY